MTKQSIIKNNIYLWKGFNSAGSLEKGEIHSISLPIAKAELRRQGINLIKIKRKSILNFLHPPTKKVASHDITAFSRQLATLLIAGIPLVQSFGILAREHSNLSVQKLIKNIQADVERGLSFSHSLTKYPTHFNQLFCNLVNAGEQSGTLELMLARIATYKEKMQSLKAKIKKALFYPVAVLIIALLVTGGMLIFIIPQFETLFNNFGADLPAVTRLVISLSRFCQHDGWLILSILSLSIAIFIRAKRRHTQFAQLIDQLTLRIPCLGSIIKKAIYARFSRTLAITFAAGLPLIDALQAIAGAAGNLIYTKAIEAVRQKVTTGQQLHIALKETQLFSSFLIKMIAVGEETGSLDTMLSKIADFYEEEVDNAVSNLSSLIEPVLMVILGTLVGGLVIAMYLPLFKLGGIV